MDTLFNQVLGESLTFSTVMLILGVSLALGLAVSLFYMLTHKKEGFVPSFAVTLVLLPMIISVIIMLIGDNVARAFSLAGAFTIVRYRSAPADPKDITYIFATLAIGLALGLGYVGYAVLFAVFICLVALALSAANFGVPRCEHMLVKITIPENLNYQGLFDDIFKEYATSFRLKKVKTTDFGALFEVVYFVELKKGCDQKEFIDKIRSRNGNLNVALIFKEYEDKLYEN